MDTQPYIASSVSSLRFGLSNLSSVNTFGALSNFLRGALADEDSRRFSESLAVLASHTEAVVAGLRQDRRRAHAGPLLMDLLTVLREHRSMVVDLGSAWRSLYEYAGYLQALNNLRVLIGQWLLQPQPWDEALHVTAEDFTLVAWRTLGEGMLLIDMYEQCLGRDDAEEPAQPAAPPGQQAEPAPQWWQKLRR